LRDASACVALLQSMDQVVCQDPVAGETTCALAVVTRTGIYGASVGDSGVWVITERGFTNLTEHQSRKPFIGSGSAWPSPFDYKITDRDSLLLATDGLLKYSSSERILAVCLNHAGSEIPRTLVELVRYASGRCRTT